MKVNLKTIIQDTVELTYNADEFDLNVVNLNKRSLDIRMKQNEISGILAAGMECTVEFDENRRRGIHINRISAEDGYLKLKCRFLGKCPEELLVSREE
jgi:hypothetical protein